MTSKVIQGHWKPCGLIEIVRVSSR